MEPTKRHRVELRVTPKQKQAIEMLAEKRGSDMSNIIKDWLERTAKREGCWPK